MRTARIAQIGARVMPFRTVRYSEKLLQNSGISVETEDMSEIFADAAEVSDAQAQAKAEEIRGYANICPGISEEKVLKQARLIVALENWMRDHHCDASAIQCWDSVEANYGCAACLAMSMMGSKGMPSACETDVMGAVSMLALLKAGGVPPIYQDWDNNYATVPDKCVNVHCCNYPVSAFTEKPELANLDILATTLGAERLLWRAQGPRAPLGDDLSQSLHRRPSRRHQVLPRRRPLHRRRAAHLWWRGRMRSAEPQRPDALHLQKRL